MLQSIGHSTGCSIGYSIRYIQLVEVFQGLEGLNQVCTRYIGGILCGIS